MVGTVAENDGMSSLQSILHGIEVPAFLPGDQPITVSREAVWILPTGETLTLTGLDFITDGERAAAVAAFMGRSAEIKARSNLTSDVTLGGKMLWVSTIFIGMNMNLGPGPALLWETMIFRKDEGATDHQWRYGSQRAAAEGHRIVTRALEGAGG